MAPKNATPKTIAAEADLAAVAKLLGGRRWLGGGALEDPLSFSLHDRLVRGLPASALTRFTCHFPQLAQDPAFVRILGRPPSSRDRRRLGSHESGQLWRITSILVKAKPLFGGTAAAERWLVQHAIGLGGRRPLDLLETPAGYALVDDHLVQLEHGVYV